MEMAGTNLQIQIRPRLSLRLKQLRLQKKMSQQWTMKMWLKSLQTERHTQAKLQRRLGMRPLRRPVVLDDTSATQEQINAAVTAINEAAQTYEAAKNTAAVDKSALTAAIEDATTKAAEQIAVSEDGKDLILRGTEYVTSSDKKAFEDAIAKRLRRSWTKTIRRPVRTRSMLR